MNSKIQRPQPTVEMASLMIVANIEGKETFFFFDKEQSKTFAVACPAGTLKELSEKLAEDNFPPKL